MRWAARARLPVPDSRRQLPTAPALMGKLQFYCIRLHAVAACVIIVQRHGRSYWTLLRPGSCRAQPAPMRCCCGHHPPTVVAFPASALHQVRKEFGKTKIYIPSQEGLSAATPEEAAAAAERLKQLQVRLVQQVWHLSGGGRCSTAAC